MKNKLWWIEPATIFIVMTFGIWILRELMMTLGWSYKTFITSSVVILIIMSVSELAKARVKYMGKRVWSKL